MNILTKISVVVLLVLVLLACPVFITKATIGPSWRGKFQEEHAARIIEQQKRKNKEVALARAVQILQNTSIELTKALGDKKRMAETHRDELKKRETENEDLRARMAGLESKYTQLEQTWKADVAHRDLLKTQLDKTREAVSTLTKQNLRLSDLYKTAQTQVERFEKVVRVLREQLAAKVERIKALEIQLATAGAPVRKASTPPEYAPGTVPDVIIGKVKNVNQAKDIVSINIGKTKGVRRGMVLIVGRGAQYVGDLRIDEVSADEAVGVMTLKRVPPMIGDRVTNK